MDIAPDENQRHRDDASGAAPQPAVVRCAKCGRSIDSSAAFCPHCGQRQQDGDAWYHRPLWIFILGFLVIGPLALPLIWKSKKMSVPAKWAMAILLIAYTAYGVYFLYRATLVDLKQLDELNRVMRNLK